MSATRRRSGDAPDDLFKVTDVANGADVAGTVEESGTAGYLAGVGRQRGAGRKTADGQRAGAAAPGARGREIRPRWRLNTPDFSAKVT